MNPRKEATYRMLSLIAAMIFVLPCVCLVFPAFDIHLDNLWQMDSLMAFICAYKNTLILAIAGVLIQIMIALPAGYAIARVSSFKAQTFFILTCVFFLLLPQPERPVRQLTASKTARITEIPFFMTILLYTPLWAAARFLSPRS